jgi:hypothetical protein
LHMFGDTRRRLAGTCCPARARDPF